MSNAPWNSDTREKALAYLVKGVSPSQCAEALGISPSVISTLMSEEKFAETLAAKKFELSEKHNRHDDTLDELEASLVSKVKELIPMIVRPMELIRAASVVNSMKRRGAPAPIASEVAPVIVQLSLPTAILSRFTLNSHNQVIAAGDQDLVTIQSNKVADLVATKIPSQSRENQYAHNSLSIPDSTAEPNPGIQRQERNSVQEPETARIKYERIDEFGFDYKNQSL